MDLSQAVKKDMVCLSDESLRPLSQQKLQLQNTNLDRRVTSMDKRLGKLEILDGYIFEVLIQIHFKEDFALLMEIHIVDSSALSDLTPLNIICSSLAMGLTYQNAHQK